MSLILDALRKSERSRQRTLSGQLGTAPTPTPGRLPMPWVSLLGAILLINALVLGFLLWRSPPAPAPAVAGSDTGPVARHKPAIRSLSHEAGQAAPAMQAPVAAPVAAHSAAAAPDAVPVAPALDTLPPAFQHSLPALHLDVHGYANSPAERFVVINMQRYVTGDTLAEGPRVVAITAQGVILEYRGTRFLLPRG
ncbi:MAG TPA: general secretion pathway protein GspB [Gammaproteobacteria bacterium]|nr:general secretion pathway protein GspB [Gammaproteobacteria bacterium]